MFIVLPFSFVSTYYFLRGHTHLIKMFGGNVHGAVEPANSPSIKANAVEYFFVAQGGKEFVLLNEWQTVEDTLATIVESQMQPIVIKRTGSSNPFQFVFYFHTLIQWSNLCQSLAILHTLPVLHQFVLVQVEPLEDKMQSTAWHLPRYPTRLDVNRGTILVRTWKCGGL